MFWVCLFFSFNFFLAFYLHWIEIVKVDRKAERQWGRHAAKVPAFSGRFRDMFLPELNWHLKYFYFK